jgi:hypothetical protein
MMRKIVGGTTLALVAGLAVWQWSDRTEAVTQTPKAGQPPFVHSVIFYLKKDTPPAKVEAMISDCHTILAKIPSVKSVWAGRPAVKGTDITVKDYQVGLLVLFDNDAGLKAYIDHPAHLKFVETYKTAFEKVLVYDFENQTK